MEHTLKKLVVVPNDPLHAYKDAGYPDQTGYFNPGGFFDKVFSVTPWEDLRGPYKMYGMTVYPTSGPDFWETIEKIGPYVIRFYDWRCYALRSLLPSSPHRRPVIVLSIHDSDARRIPFPVPLTKKLLPDICISMSTVVDRMATDAGIPSSSLRRIYNRVDTSLFRPVPEWRSLSVYQALELANADPVWAPPVQAGLPWILVVGRMSEQKNQTALLKAFLMRRREYVCVFVGKGASWIKKSAYYDPNRMILVERVPNKSLHVLYNACDLFVLPTLWEGFGTVFIEAMACGSLVLTSPTAPMTDYMDHGRNALFFDRMPYYPEVIAEGIENAFRLKESFPGKVVAITKEAVESAQKFTVQNVDRMEVNIYKEVLGWYQKHGRT